MPLNPKQQQAELDNLLQQDKNRLEDYLKSNLTKSSEYSKKLYESMRYSLLSKGKRIRPLLFFIVLRCNGIKIDNFVSFAAALEALHCYTLIHDDLPALDNDNLRRGQTD